MTPHEELIEVLRAAIEAERKCGKIANALYVAEQELEARARDFGQAWMKFNERVSGDE